MDLLKYYGFDWLAVIIGTIGIWQLGSKKRSGFLFYMAAAAAGFMFAFFANSVAYMAANFVAFFLQLRGFLKWRKEDSAKG
jgi:hypothetical protein